MMANTANISTIVRPNSDLFALLTPKFVFFSARETNRIAPRIWTLMCLILLTFFRDIRQLLMG